MPLKLYDYWRSSAAYRVRIALNLKGVAFTTETIDIRPGSDEQLGAKFVAINPQMRVPALEASGEIFSQSMAIIEWIEEAYPHPSILPTDQTARVKCRAFAHTIACDVHPLNNLSVLRMLRSDFSAGEKEISRWYSHWTLKGFAALETIASKLPPTTFLFGESPSLAEICLVPQIYNARRYNVDLSAFPRLVEVEAKACELSPFKKASPDQGRKNS